LREDVVVIGIEFRGKRSQRLDALPSGVGGEGQAWLSFRKRELSTTWGRCAAPVRVDPCYYKEGYDADRNPQ